jgi:putative transposase
LALLHDQRFVDRPPAQVWAQLLDADELAPCSIRTMYRVLAANAEGRERRHQLRHPAYRKPEVLATGPNQVWSWDTTKLLDPVKWTYYYLYVLVDIFSRYVLGWLLGRHESAALATVLIAESCERQHIAPDQLTLHADRRPAMTTKPVARLLATPRARCPRRVSQFATADIQARPWYAVPLGEARPRVSGDPGEV